VSTPPPGEDAATRTARFGIELDKGSEVAGRYRIEGLLGIGGMGVVYRAFDRALEVPVALKLLRPELAPRSCWRARCPARGWCASTTSASTKVAG
jgi:eukaryotic-like serine/threonine-protein kinase